MTFNIITIGKPHEEVLKLTQNYIKKIKHFVNINYLPQKDIKIKNSKIKIQEEEKLLLSEIGNGFLCILDEKGKSFNSIEFSNFIKKNIIEENQNINFVIGGAFGISEKIKKRANLILKLSDFTLQHDIALIVLLEQLYRALTIIKNIPYHK